MSKLSFAELPALVKAAVFISFHSFWVVTEEFVIDRYGYWRYLPGYEYGCFCIWDAGVILLLVVWAVLIWRPRQKQAAS